MALKGKAGKKVVTKNYRATREPEPPREPREEARPEPAREERGRGYGNGNRQYSRGGGQYNRGGSRNGGGQGDMEFERISGLFPGRKEGSFSAFVNYDMEKILRELRGGDRDNPGDSIGVSTSDDGKMYLWVGHRK